MAIFEDGSYSCIPGIALLAKVLAGRCQMKYTRAAVGKGEIPGNESPKTMQEPADYVMDAQISDITNPVNGECQVTVQINSSNVEYGFFATSILLYAEDPDEGEVPYTYLVMENGPEWIRPSSSAVGKLATFDLIAAVGEIDCVTASIDPNSFVTRVTVEKLIAGATVKREITIPFEGWDVGAEEKPDSYFIDISQADVTENMVPLVSIYPASMETAKSCGLSTTARTMKGALRLYAEKAPTAEITAMLTLFFASSGPAGELIYVPVEISDKKLLPQKEYDALSEVSPETLYLCTEKLLTGEIVVEHIYQGSTLVYSRSDGEFMLPVEKHIPYALNGGGVYITSDSKIDCVRHRITVHDEEGD